MNDWFESPGGGDGNTFPSRAWGHMFFEARLSIDVLGRSDSRGLAMPPGFLDIVAGCCIILLASYQFVDDRNLTLLSCALRLLPSELLKQSLDGIMTESRAAVRSTTLAMIISWIILVVL